MGLRSRLGLPTRPTRAGLELDPLSPLPRRVASCDMSSEIITRLATFLRQHPGVDLSVAFNPKADCFLAMAAWGEEASDSPMAGAAINADGDSLDECLGDALKQAGY
jgi:hypothetical protein